MFTVMLVELQTLRRKSRTNRREMDRLERELMTAIGLVRQAVKGAVATFSRGRVFAMG